MSRGLSSKPSCRLCGPRSHAGHTACRHRCGDGPCRRTCAPPLRIQMSPVARVTTGRAVPDWQWSDLRKACPVIIARLGAGARDRHSARRRFPRTPASPRFGFAHGETFDLQAVQDRQPLTPAQSNLWASLRIGQYLPDAPDHAAERTLVVARIVGGRLSIARRPGGLSR